MPVYTLSMTFNCEELGKSHTLSISGVRADLTQEEVVALMDQIVARQIFFVTDGKGRITSKKSASITSRVVNELIGA